MDTTAAASGREAPNASRLPRSLQKTGTNARHVETYRTYGVDDRRFAEYTALLSVALSRKFCRLTVRWIRPYTTLLLFHSCVPVKLSFFFLV